MPSVDDVIEGWEIDLKALLSILDRQEEEEWEQLLLLLVVMVIMRHYRRRRRRLFSSLRKSYLYM